MKIFNLILEIITSPFSFFLRTNVSPNVFGKWGKAWMIFLVSLLVVFICVLFYYREVIFNR